MAAEVVMDLEGGTVLTTAMRLAFSARRHWGDSRVRTEVDPSERASATCRARAQGRQHPEWFNWVKQYVDWQTYSVAAASASSSRCANDETPANAAEREKSTPLPSTRKNRPMNSSFYSLLASLPRTGVSFGPVVHGS